MLCNMSSHHVIRMSPTGTSQLRNMSTWLSSRPAQQMLQVRVLIGFSWFFFILLYYSYELCLQVCESLRPAVVELCHFMLENRLSIYSGTSFYRFLLVLFLFCSTIAMNYTYRFSKACTASLWSYVT